VNMRDLDLNLLLVFEAVYSTGNISRAAELLDLSQPAVSNSMARLRKQLDDQLFVRSGNGVVPTSRAEAMIEPVRSALATIRQSIEPAAAFDPETSQRQFRMIIADPLEQIIMPQLLQRVGNLAGITFELQPPQSMHVEKSLLSGKTDLAAFLMPGRNAELNVQVLCPLDPVILARDDHPRINNPVTMPELVKEGFVALTLAPGKLSNSEKITIWRRLHMREICQVYKISSIPPFVAQTEMLGIVPRIYANHIAQIYGLQIVDLPIVVSDQQFHLIWHKRNEADDGHRWLREFVGDLVAKAYKNITSAPA
jgi:LysR family transcriptional regulator, transcriptional activator for leuABCD operon